MNDDLKILELRGQEALSYVERLAVIRIQVFSDFPYLYDGDLDYERTYLNTYFAAEKSFIVVVLDGEKLVGASTAVWLPQGDRAFRKPFVDKGIRPEEVCYYGESVLDSRYRGRSLGKEFMTRRETFARSNPGVRIVGFCAVKRPMEHPRRPKDYRPLDEFWKKSGFAPQTDMVAQYSWKDQGENKETQKSLQFWLKNLE